MDGTVAISGDTWLARKIGRSDDWTLLLNNTVLASGTVSSNDGHTSSSPLQFGPITEVIHKGDVITFEAVKTTGGG
jgi:hypothetical protein